MDRQNMQSTKASRWVWWCVCIALGVLVVTTVVLYMHKRDSFHRWARGQQYGQIIHVDAAAIVLSRVDGTKQVVHFTPKTKILFGRRIISSQSLKLGDFAIVAGALATRGAGQEARVIRVFPARE